ncbi:MAG TPA: hypothetical protein VFS43_11465 [Polyangiaceae bacterium]|nr:hypothetical protein [Polyangiaceae bacterium]
MTVDFDPTPYVRPPIVDVPAAVGLSVALIKAMPNPSTDEVRRSARRLRASTLALQQAWAKSDEKAPPRDKRPADVALDNAWSALYGRLESYARLPAEQAPRAERAAGLLNTIFPDGLSFLKLPYASEWAESEKRLTKIDQQKLGSALDELAGPDFLTVLRAAHADYGAALGMTKALAAGPTPVSLAEPLREVTRAIANYTLKLCAMADDDASIAAVQNALRPLDEYRESTARRPTKAAPGEPDTPLPDLPGEGD